MALPLLTYSPSSQNQRVVSYEVPGDEQPRIYTTENILSASEMDTLIHVAYRQICNEQQMLASNRQRFLESQLRVGQITVKDFIRGLAISDSFRRLVYNSNNNYRFVQICIQRILGREVYNDREKMAWSIVLATKGLPGFIDDLLNSEEYSINFGEDIVPYQRRRILPQRSQGDLPFERMARYGIDYRNKLPKSSLSDPWAPIQRADGLFTQNERFDFATFVERANGPMVAALLLPVCGIIIVMLAVAIGNQ